MNDIWYNEKTTEAVDWRKGKFHFTLLLLSLTADEMRQLAHAPQNLIKHCEHGVGIQLNGSPCTVLKEYGGYEQTFHFERSVQGIYIVYYVL